MASLVSPEPPERVRWAVQRMAARSNDRVLEIGCGAGHAVELLGPIVTRGTIVAIDRSALQVKKARERNRAVLLSGRARIEPFDLEEAPSAFGERAFTKVLAVNVNLFWTAPARSLAALARLLDRRGSAHLVYEPPSAAALPKIERELSARLEERGFTREDVEVTAFGAKAGLYIRARLAR
jgi:SAM-dependent methyltransferase